MLLRVQGHTLLAEQLVAVEAVALVVCISVLAADEGVQRPRFIL